MEDEVSEGLYPSRDNSLGDDERSLWKPREDGETEGEGLYQARHTRFEDVGETTSSPQAESEFLYPVREASLEGVEKSSSPPVEREAEGLYGIRYIRLGDGREMSLSCAFTNVDCEGENFYLAKNLNLGHDERSFLSTRTESEDEEGLYSVRHNSLGDDTKISVLCPLADVDCEVDGDLQPARHTSFDLQPSKHTSLGVNNEI
ncbi:hypothetical protein EGW08_023865, partial [Elysia chlorotica]